MKPYRTLGIPLLAGALAACTAITPGYADLALNDLFNVERAFARSAQAHGVGAAFDQYLARDAIVFRPGPVTYLREGTPPRTPDPAAPRLEWAPQAGAVARSGDLGYTTGPYRTVQRGVSVPLDQGYFFTVWKRVDGAWRVAVDAGVATTTPPPQEGVANFLKAVVVDPPAQPTAAALQAARDELLALERAPRSLAELPQGMPGFYGWTRASTRWLRTGPPAVFGAGIRDELVAGGGQLDWVPAEVTVAASNDLAYTLGRYTRTYADGRTSGGYYVHVWQRDDLREWKLAVMTWLPPA